MCIKNHDRMIHVSWSMEWERQNFLTFWAIFWPFTTRPSNDPENQKLEMKKTSGDIILHICTINDNQSYDAWFLRARQAEFLSFWTVLCTFTPLRTQKIKILKTMKKTPGDIIILHMCTINDNHMMYGSWDMEVDGQNVILDHFSAFLPPNNQKNQNFEKLKKLLEILSFYTYIP